jgi:hypothetical protein
VKLKGIFLTVNCLKIPIGNEAIHKITESLKQELVLGREGFKERIEQMLKRLVRAGMLGCPRVEEMQAIYYVI